jgi:type I restriction enzyme S subunit
VIDGLKPYPAMKDSGVPWLGEVPEHWETERAKWLFRRVNRPVRASDEVVTCFRDGTVTLRKNRRIRGFTESIKEIGYQGIRRGDLVIHAMDAFAGAVGVANADGKGTPVYSVCEPAPVADSHYYAYAVREMARSQWIQALAKGIRERSTDFRFEGFGSQPVPLPPLPEQVAIVRFLDHADRRIRRYICAKQKLIKLLEEQKQAIIHRAVIRGLDPNVRLKPSGVEWLGDVPEHWEVVRLKSLVSRVTSGSRGWSNFAADSGVLFIRIGNLTRASLDLDLESSVRLQLPAHVLGEAARTRIQRDDILLSITAFIGSVAVVPRDIEEAYVSQHVACCRPRVRAANTRWVGYVLLSHVGQTHGQLSMYGGTKQSLSLDDVKNYVVLIPPRDEQDLIVNWIEGATKSVDAGVRSTRREISLLREYRTRLIADVVTGKLDVREAAARLPDEAEESGPLDEADADADTEETIAGEVDEVPEEAEA